EDTYKGLTPDELVGQSADNLRFARDNTNVITVDLAKAVLSNPNLAPKLSADKREVFESITRASAQSSSGSTEGELRIVRDETPQDIASSYTSTSNYTPAARYEEQVRTSPPPVANNMTQQQSGLWTTRPTAPPPPPANSERPPTPPGDGSGS